jgi:hypothetical protein
VRFRTTQNKMGQTHEKPHCIHDFKKSEPYDGFYECEKCGHRCTKSEALFYWECVLDGLIASNGWRPGEIDYRCL